MTFLWPSTLVLLCFCGTLLAKDLSEAPTTFIGGGSEAVRHSAPYIVSINQRKYPNRPHEHICSGVIIDRSFVVTTYGCVWMGGGGGSVVAGMHERTNFDNHTQLRTIDFTRQHPLHRPQGAGTLKQGPHDIAIIHLSEPFVFNEYVQPVTLPVQNEIYTGRAFMYGWGGRSLLESKAPALHTLEMNVMDWNECKSSIPDPENLHPTEVCAASALINWGSACYADEGAPLVIEKKDTPAELVGIVTRYYFGCGSNRQPTIYARISEYTKWLNDMQTAYNILY